MAQTLKFGNGTWATKKDSILAYNDENENYKPLPFNYTGAGKGTRVNKEGLIEVVENDRPRIDYTDSEDGVFLLEKAATNLITYSEDFSQWVQTRVTNTDNETTSPDGSLNASLITEDATLNSKYTFLNLSTTTNEHSLSFFAKYKGRYLQVLFGTNDVSGNPYINFDLQNGTFDNNGVSNPSIEDFGNGWYKCSLSVTPTVTSDFGVLFSPIQSFTSSRLISYQGDGTSGVYIYGAQLESGNLSSYIPTQGSIQTRVAETANGSGNSEVFNDSEGVLFADIEFLTLSNTYNDFFGLNNGSNSQRLLIERNTDVLKTYVGSAFLTTTLNSLNNKISISYKLNNFKMYLNGFEVDSVTSGTTPNGLDRFDFKIGGSLSLFTYAKAKEIGYYDEVLTDLELETLTSYRTWESMVKELNLNVIYNG
jgi:hypothetical protein